MNDTPPNHAPPPPAESVEPVGPVRPVEQHHPLSFSGSGGEYFRIWIVNVCLTIITLGLYAAWAKVRTQRYMYAHTRLDGSPFDYLAQPERIFRGQMVAMVALALYYLASYLHPLGGVVVIVLVLLALPWVVMKSLRFRAVNSQWRGVRFGFSGEYADGFNAYLLAALPVVVTLGLAYPYLAWRRRRLPFAHSRFGTTGFAIADIGATFFRPYAIATGTALAIGALILTQTNRVIPTLPDAISPTVILMPFALAATFIGAAIYVQAHTTNLLWNNARLGSHRFSSTLTPTGLLWIHLSNLALVAASIGLALPWAKVRLMRYRVENIAVVSRESLSDFAAAEADNVSAVGEELGETLDLDLGL